MTSKTIKVLIVTIAFVIELLSQTSVKYSIHLNRGNCGYKIGGSFLIVTTCKDGILIAADSRSTISDSLGKKLAYYDGVQKIFPIGNFALAYTGQEIIQNIYFGAIVDSYVSTIKDEISLDKLLPSFLSYTDSHLPITASLQVRRQMLITAGFIDGKHVSSYYNEAQTIGPKTEFGLGFISSDITILDEKKKYLKSMKPEDVAVLIRRAIEKYAETNNFCDIGGQIYVLYISRNNFRWIGPEPITRKWDYFHEFAQAYWNNKIYLHLLPGVDRNEVDELIKKEEKWSINVR